MSAEGRGEGTASITVPISPRQSAMDGSSARWSGRRKATMMRAGFGQARALVDPAGGDRSRMKRSSERILTTHTGSLPRTAKVVELLLAEQRNRGARKGELAAAVGEAIAYV